MQVPVPTCMEKTAATERPRLACVDPSLVTVACT